MNHQHLQLIFATQTIYSKLVETQEESIRQTYRSKICNALVLKAVPRALFKIYFMSITSIQPEIAGRNWEKKGYQHINFWLTKKITKSKWCVFLILTSKRMVECSHSETRHHNKNANCAHSGDEGQSVRHRFNNENYSKTTPLRYSVLCLPSKQKGIIKEKESSAYSF